MVHDKYNKLNIRNKNIIFFKERFGVAFIHKPSVKPMLIKKIIHIFYKITTLVISLL